MLHDSPFLAMLRSFPQGKPYLVSGKHRYRTEDLLEKSSIVAANLKNLGATPDEIAVIVLPPGEDFLLSMFAALQLRLKVAIIDPQMGRENYSAKLKQLDPTWAFVDSRILLLQEHPLLRYAINKFKPDVPDFPSGTRIKVISGGPRMPLVRRFQSLRKLRQGVPESADLIQDTANPDFLITYTSGTLDVPKGVLHSVDSLINSILQIRQRLNARDQMLATYLPHFMLLAICCGLTVVLYDPNWSPKKKIAFFERNRVTTLFGPPSDFLELVQYAELANRQLPACLQHLLLGSAPVHPVFLQRLASVIDSNVDITCLYGMTELLVAGVVDGRLKAHYDGRGDLLGSVPEGTSVRFADDHEIFLKSPQLFSRYFHQQDRPEWHSTGDLGHITADQQLVLIGRKKDMIIRRNFNIYPAIYENTIKKISHVQDASLIGIWNPEKQDEDVYLVVEGDSIEESRLRSALQFGQYSIDKEAWPDKIVNMTLPRKGRQNKTDKAALRQHLQGLSL